MYEETSKPLVKRTLATLRSAELGFLGVVVYTRVHTPRRCGQFSMAGLLDLTFSTTRPRRTSWLMVGMVYNTVNGRARHLVRRTESNKHPGATMAARMTS